MARILVICEKPTAAMRIAQALDEKASPEEHGIGGVPYFTAQRGVDELIMVSALGHLFTVAQKSKGWTYPMFDLKWVPVYEADRSAAKTRGFIAAIDELSKGADGYISACDYDVEGSLIAYNILLNVCGEESLKRARRMRYSTLTDRDLVKAWESMSPQLDYPMIEAGKARHEVDWLFGINLSRALTLSLKNATGHYKTLSVGRVQGPTLNFVAEREVEIRSHVPIPFWVIDAETEIEGKRYSLEYEKAKMETEPEAFEVEKACKGRDGIIKTIRSNRLNLPPPHPFNLGDLQREAYNQLRSSPRTTLSIAERLYLDALISYPRTSSQRLPPSIDLRDILRGLSRKRDYHEMAESLLSKRFLRPNNGEKEDPAHPAIHPTGNIPGKLSPLEFRVFDLICRRFMATLGDQATRIDTTATVEVNEQNFYLKGNRVVEPGWRLYYAPYIREKETPLPSLREGQVLPLARLEILGRFTKLPPRFNPSSLLKVMEDEEIGTKATRAEIIDTLSKRDYVEGNPLVITDLGFSIVEALLAQCPRIMSIEMTRALEKDLEHIQSGEASGDSVVHKAIETLKPVLVEFKAREKIIGAEINEALMRAISRSNVLGQCPICKSGEIRLIRNRQTGKRFAGCSNYRNGSCSVSFPLPQKGKIHGTGKTCPRCGSPIVKLTRWGKRPWEFCINIDCSSKKK